MAGGGRRGDGDNGLEKASVVRWQVLEHAAMGACVAGEGHHMEAKQWRLISLL